jgi:2-polyprenyl-6-methoxyphenol hydroxylase-like FAD-dependent oxidoreductase
MSKRHAEIAGAGLSGLTAAAALGKAGWSVRVHERNDELRELGAGILVWGNGIWALKQVGAFEDATRGTDFINDWELRDERNRTLQHEWMLPGEYESYAILRTQLHQALVKAAERVGVEIVTSSPVASATTDGELILASGERCKADLVVGADGIRSKVRESVGLAERVTDLGDGCGRHLIERTPDDIKDQIIERWDGGRRIGIVPCTQDKIYIYLCCPEADTVGVAQESGDLSSWKKSFPEFADYIDRIPPGGRWASFGDVRARKWSAGNVALVGDAAHSMSPNLGQAACVAMMNAVALSRRLDEFPTIPAALTRWEETEREITDRTQKYSRFYGWIGTHWPDRALPVRSALIWSLAHSKRAQAHINAAARYKPVFERSAGSAAVGSIN